MLSFRTCLKFWVTSYEFTDGRIFSNNRREIFSRIGSGVKVLVSVVTRGPPTSIPTLKPVLPCIEMP